MRKKSDFDQQRIHQVKMMMDSMIVDQLSGMDSRIKRELLADIMDSLELINWIELVLLKSCLNVVVN